MKIGRLLRIRKAHVHMSWIPWRGAFSPDYKYTFYWLKLAIEIGEIEEEEE